MRIFISGGCKNGKSTLARRLAVAQRALSGELYYIATMVPTGDDDLRRIARHRAERAGDGFTTLEQPRDVSSLIDTCDSGASFLLDSLTALLQNEMFRDGEIHCDAHVRVIAELTRLLDAAENIVVVSDFIYADAGIYDAATERYRECLALVDRAAAERCDAVLEVCYSGIIVHKGELDL
ncbi:MAG: bifunctional adenosylcobinamide kinase/adenosylcobinamide-phosphate guanylyltransferase [Oscillospiraceae bacterium]|nr:bifunctional adenosylcobinamide kinase/adenosylcobinamide-phosphate guanylyltransferase [Oscillospiraceae bacterium]